MTIHEIAERLQPRVEDLCRELLPQGTKQGHEWKAGDVTGAPGDSLTVELTGPKAGLWCDQATSEGGDIIDLIAASRMLSVGKAAAWARQWLGIPNDIPNGSTAANGHFDPLKVGFKRQDETVWRNGSAAWTYHDADGKPIGWVVRFDRPGGGKEILPLRMVDGKPKWKGWKNPEPKPLYNLHLLARRPDAPILIVEGEKTADAAAKLFPESVVMTWAAGAKNVSSADWAPVVAAVAAGRPLRLWPDADKPGREAMLYLKARFPSALMVRTEDLPDGWDLADPVPAGVSLQGLYDAAGQAEAEPVKRPEEPDPYRVLGICDSEVFFHSYRSGDIINFTPAAMTELNLQLLAPDSFWRAKGYSPDGIKVDYRDVAKALIEKAHENGRFSPDLVRGRGCWIDPDPVTHARRVVFNAGDRIFIDGVQCVGRPDSRYSYRSGSPIPVDLSIQASDEDGRKLTRLCNLLPYSDSTLRWIIPAILFLGPTCGALDFRPGAWTDGEQGSGKSTLYSEFFGRIWSGCCYRFTGATSEAGIRQDTGSDALPVTFDEAEARTPRSVSRLDAVLELIRQSSTETGGRIVKGSASGTAVSFEVRSMFALFSIAAPAMETADESRMARVTLTKNHDPARWNEMQSILSEIDDAFCLRLRSRAILSVLRIRDSYELFRRLIAKHTKNSRKGQQFGTLAAGIWCLENQGIPSESMAQRFVESQPWPDLGAGTDDNSDQQLCLSHLLQYRTHWQDAEARRHDESVAGLIRLWRDSETERHAAQQALNLIGLHITPSGLHVANKHPGVSQIFKGTQFDARWKDYLKRLPDAIELPIKIVGVQTRTTRVQFD